MKRIALAVIGLSSVSLFAFAGGETKISQPVEPAGIVGGTVNLSDDPVVLNGLTSFGRAGHGIFPGISAFMVGEIDSVLYQHQDYLSSGGPPRAITSTNCTIVSPITAIAPNEAVSTVQCGMCTVDYHHLLDGLAQTWTTDVTFTGCDVGCFYSYTDYDVHGFPNNGGSWQAAGGGFLGQFVVRNNLDRPDVHYTFGDGSGADHWGQDSFPTILTFLDTLTTCGNLRDMPDLFPNGDWTGAIQYIAPVGSVTYVLGRDDTTTFP